MQLKIPFGSSWELLRVALPEWWEYSILAPQTGVSVCSGKMRASAAGTRVHLPPGPTVAPLTRRWHHLHQGWFSVEGGGSPAPSQLLEECHTGPTLWLCQERIICTVVVISNHFPFGEHLASWIMQLLPGKGAEHFPVTSRC